MLFPYNQDCLSYTDARRHLFKVYSTRRYYKYYCVMITVTINDQQHSLRDGITLSALLTDFDVSTRGAAVAVNNRVITRSAWPTHQLHDGDRILIIKAAQGG